MSMVELGKSLHRRATDLLCGRRLVFHHVPKCGGTSVGRALRSSYLLSQGTVTPEESLKAFAAANRGEETTAIGDVFQLREMMLLYMLYSDVRCISAHIPFSNAAFSRFEKNYAFVTLLRDPVDRFISNYLWSHKRKDAEGHVPESFEDFLATPRASQMGSVYLRYFSGESTGRLHPRQISSAINNLHRMSFVGFLDDIPHFEAGLRTLTGKRLRIGKENVGRTGGRREEIMSGPLRDKVLAACEPDREIWEAVQDLRKCRVANAAAGTERDAGSSVAEQQQAL
jgi:hypothetical protein